jgi:hypothetical protein
MAAAAALLLVAALAACGGSGSDSTSTAGSASTRAEGKASGEASAAKRAENGGGEGKSGSAAGSAASGGQGGEGATSFKPGHHRDSGGGSAQYRVKGGDNSVQEFGKETEGSEFQKAAAVLHDFLDARAQGDWTAACSYLSKSVVESFEQLAARAKKPKKTSCASTLAALINPAAKQLMQEEAKQASVGSLRTEGERAFLIYAGPDKTVIAMPMANEGGTWKVASLAGTPLS